MSIKKMLIHILLILLIALLGSFLLFISNKIILKYFTNLVTHSNSYIFIQSFGLIFILFLILTSIAYLLYLFLNKYFLVTSNIYIKTIISSFCFCLTLFGFSQLTFKADFANWIVMKNFIITGLCGLILPILASKLQKFRI